MEFVNLLYKHGQTAFAVDTLLQLLAPAAPHITAELWERRHPGEHVHERTWPVADPALAAVDVVTMVVQVNGKVRARLEVDPGIAQEDAESLALADQRVVEALAGATPKKVIARPPKIVNIVL
jgi:leucyl-tRNA synthetase